MMTNENNAQVIPGLPKTEEQAVRLIEEVENGKEEEWQPIENVLEEIAQRYEVFAY
ncbi:MAG: hypothetical protein IJ200_02500 [Prevotella sp.]|nr:hypothetical protein [Prevotella sp.]